MIGRTNVPAQLWKSPFVYERIDCHRPPLMPIYAGHFAVIEREEKAFLLNRNSKRTWVSIDRLKPAFVEEVTNAAGGGEEVCNRPSSRLQEQDLQAT